MWISHFNYLIPSYCLIEIEFIFSKNGLWLNIQVRKALVYVALKKGMCHLGHIYEESWRGGGGVV